MELEQAIWIALQIQAYATGKDEPEALEALIACAQERITEDAAVTAHLQRTGRIDPGTAEALAEWQAGSGVDSTATAGRKYTRLVSQSECDIWNGTTGQNRKIGDTVSVPDSTATAKAILDQVDKRADATYGKVGEVDLTGQPKMYAGATDIARAIIRDAEQSPELYTCPRCGWVGLARNTAHGCSTHREARLNEIKTRQA